MWVYIIILSILLALGITRIISSFEAQSVMSQWAKYRCMPEIMFWASMFKPADDPRSEIQFTTDNFSFCTSEIAKSALETAIKPLLDVFVKMIESSIASIGYVMNLRSLSSNLFHGLERIFDIFGRRFNMTIHELHKTFVKQMTAMQKANSIAVSSLFAGLSLIKSIMNAFELMITVSIAILVILVVMVIFLFFLLAPVIPLILTAITVIGTTAYAGNVGGMSGAFCFEGGTRVAMSNGLNQRIDSIKLDDILADGSKVISVLKFKTYPNTLLYNIDGIVVSGSHIIYQNGVAILVKDAEGAKIYNGELPEVIYCLNTSSHYIPIVGNKHTLIFADWEELDNESMDDWNKFVYERLNSGNKQIVHVKNDDILNSETGISPHTEICVLMSDSTISVKRFSDLIIGDKIMDVDGYTTVIGLVTIAQGETKVFGNYDGILMSGACWVLNQTGTWNQAIQSDCWMSKSPVCNMISIFTESGTFKINNTVLRDYSDIGLENIDKTYDFTLSRLNSAL